MTYLAITQSMADWIIGKTGILDILHNLLVQADDAVNLLSGGDFVEGPYRISLSENREVVAIWNIDYLSGTGEELWGFIKNDTQMGLKGEPTISREVFERCIYIINQRLQGFYIDGSYIHRFWPSNGAHTCLAGRGSAARDFNLAYFERNVDAAAATQHAIICVGPAFDFGKLTKFAVSESSLLDGLIDQANALTSPHRRRKIIENAAFKSLRQALGPYSRAHANGEYDQVKVETGKNAIEQRDVYRASGLTYEEWLSPSSPLTNVQRRILLSNAIEKHPLRIVGPGGSGKTLLMQLLALRRLQIAQQKNQKIRVLYIVHNAAMAESVKQRFDVLDAGKDNLRNGDRILDVYTLSDYGRRQLDLDANAVIDPDAYESKVFQFEQISEALRDSMNSMPATVSGSELFAAAQNNQELFSILARLVTFEISNVIKGHGLENDKRRYVQSERRLSRLHGILSQEERQLVYHTYKKYHDAVFEGLEVLDTDDIALSLLGKLRTPIWELKRRKLGYDFVFVDETQLFNENERRVFPLLTGGASNHVPIALALDEAQDIYSQSTAGMATLGIPDIANESLESVHRSTKSIIRLAFFVIQRSTDLFGPDFPDFTGMAQKMEEDNHPLAAPPTVEVASEEVKKFGKFIVKRIRELRRANLWRIAVICHADQYWDTLTNELRAADLPLHVLLQRGEKLSPDQPMVVLTRPPYAGGQEFDAVILVGLEQGVVPPRIVDNEALSAAVEQQTLREIYLAVTRARYRLIVALTAGATLTNIMQEAERTGLLHHSS